MKRLVGRILAALIVFVSVCAVSRIEVRAVQSYTVEFTYGDVQYVMQGGTTVALRDVLETLGISGTVTNVCGSNDALFSFSKPHEGGQSAGAGEWMILSHQPFLTEEWMDVTVDGDVIRVVVTDDPADKKVRRGDGTTLSNGNVSDYEYQYIKQGKDYKTFAKEAPIASIFIDENMIKTGTPTYEFHYTGYGKDHFVFNRPAHNDKFRGTYFLSYRMKPYDDSTTYEHEPLKNATTNSTPANADNFFGDPNKTDNPLITYTYKDAATLSDGSKADVEFVYSNLHIVLHGTEKDVPDDAVLDLLGGNRIVLAGKSGQTTDNWRYGVKVDVTIRVSKSINTYPQGQFYFKSSDIDQKRDSGRFTKLYDASNNMSYSEQIELLDGFLWETEGNTRKPYIYLPGGRDNLNNKDNNGLIPNGQGYLCDIDEKGSKDSTRYHFKPNIKDETDSVYSGFLTLADNSEKGIQLRVTSDGGYNAGDIVTVKTFLLAGSPDANASMESVYYSLRASTTAGGKIQTTSSGNESGVINASTQGIIEPAGVYGITNTLTVPGGKDIKYTMTPDPQWVLKSVTVANNTLDFNETGITRTVYTPGSLGSVSEVRDPYTNEILYYTFAFNNIQQNQAIHVEWGKRYYESYEYRIEGGASDGSDVPGEVSATLPSRKGEPHTVHFISGEQIAPAAPQKTEVTVTAVPGEFYRYSFQKWTDSYANTDYTKPVVNSEPGRGNEYWIETSNGQSQTTAREENIKFTGHWKKERVFTESYRFRMDDSNVTYPAALDGFLPDTATPRYFIDGATVTALPPQGKNATVGSQEYYFVRWEESEKTVERADVAFVGIWSTSSPLSEQYRYEGDNLPQRVRETIPTRAGKYYKTEKVDAARPTSESVTDGHFTYTFDGWKVDPQVVEDHDVVFVGTWTVTEDPKYPKEHRYEGFDELPDEVKATLPPGGGAFYDGDPVYPDYPVPTEVTAPDGTVYSFRGWDKDHDTVNGGPVVFTGRWEITYEPTYTEEYSFEGTLPKEVLELIPVRANRYNNGTDVTPAGPKETVIRVGELLYTFAGWDKPNEIINGKNAVFTGRWLVTPAPKYTELYVYDGELPDEVKATIPGRAGTYYDNDRVYPVYPSKDPVQVGNFVFTFNGWDKTEHVIKGAHAVFIGTWSVRVIDTPAPVTPTPPVTPVIPGVVPPAPDPVQPLPDPEPPAPDPATPPFPLIPPSVPSSPSPAPVTPPEPGVPSGMQVPSTEISGTQTVGGHTGLIFSLGSGSTISVVPQIPDNVEPGTFRSLQIDGVPQDVTGYRIEGNTIVLPPEILETLPEGRHVVRLIYDNIWTEAVITVLGVDRPGSLQSITAPQTGDTGAYATWQLLAVLAASVVCALIRVIPAKRRVLR